MDNGASAILTTLSMLILLLLLKILTILERRCILYISTAIHARVARILLYIHAVIFIPTTKDEATCICPAWMVSEKVLA